MAEIAIPFFISENKKGVGPVKMNVKYFTGAQIARPEEKI